MTKKEARNLINKHFNNLSKKEKKNLDSRILKNFLEFVDISKCKKIGSYFGKLKNTLSSFQKEVNTVTDSIDIEKDLEDQKENQNQKNKKDNE